MLESLVVHCPKPQLWQHLSHPLRKRTRIFTIRLLLFLKNPKLELSRIRESHDNLSSPRDAEKSSSGYHLLAETKNPDAFVLSKVKPLDYHHHVFVSPHNIANGGLALILKQDIKLEVISSCKNYFDTRIIYEDKVFYSTFVYGDPERANRRQTWDYLLDLNTLREAPWFLTGDFNDFIDNSKKEGGPVRAEGTFGDFRSFLSKGDLYDLRHSGNLFSWRGKRNDHLVRCRLDRALSNSEWAELNPSGRCEYLRYEGSDHRPLVSYFDPKRKKKKGNFRYDRQLKKNEEVTTLVAKVWTDETNKTVKEKVDQCRKAIVT
ncbi:unnamed protein product [Microthlaspi erraticum]|uniref:Endonuclease/exonuclease/phosphatase domain-containing protein n=1 Tax=Microthlaspi erraticum TaxID=1685480 RepID=A0A6D2HXR1_9BRAS|nr:unnamed protein product [Microthlaspi erraticum]